MQFIHSESGAVTVDWVVLTAALVGLGLAAMSVVSGGVDDLSNDVDSNLSDAVIYTTFAQRKHSGYYAASSKRADLGYSEYGGDVDAAFESELDYMQTLDPAHYPAWITSLESLAVARANILDYLDQEGAAGWDTAEVAALFEAQGFSNDSANNRAESYTTTLTTTHGGDAAAFRANLANQIETDSAYLTMARDVADERGIAY